MTYEKPEVSDFGSIAEHTYGVFNIVKEWCGASGVNGQYGGFSGFSGNIRRRSR